MRNALRFLLAASAALAVASPACACSIVITDRSPEADWKRAREAVDGAVLIVDGEVVRRLLPGQQTGLVKVYRVLKGPAVEVVEVEAPSSCNHEFSGVGERSRFFLYGGPTTFYELSPDASSTRVDRLLGSDRRRDWPYQPPSLQTPGR